MCCSLVAVDVVDTSAKFPPIKTNTKTNAQNLPEGITSLFTSNLIVQINGDNCFCLSLLGDLKSETPQKINEIIQRGRIGFFTVESGVIKAVTITKEQREEIVKNKVTKLAIKLNDKIDLIAEHVDLQIFGSKSHYDNYTNKLRGILQKILNKPL